MMAQPQLPDEAALKPHNFLIITISAAVLGHKHPLWRGINGAWALSLPGMAIPPRDGAQIPDTFGLPETPRAPGSCL